MRDGLFALTTRCGEGARLRTVQTVELKRRAVRQAGADKPDDEDAQLAVADVDMIGGQVGDAFSRLLDFASGHPASVDAVRRRLLEYFRICGESDPRVKHARRSIAAMMY